MRNACAFAGHARTHNMKPPRKDRDGFMSLPSHGTSVFYLTASPKRLFPVDVEARVDTPGIELCIQF